MGHLIVPISGGRSPGIKTAPPKTGWEKFFLDYFLFRAGPAFFLSPDPYDIPPRKKCPPGIIKIFFTFLEIN
jgi:hypothetical protein